jgi:ATP-dependent Clp protease ATP-binding subunit ClpX
MIRTCSFCEKTSLEVREIISGVNAYICNECVDKCKKLLSPTQSIEDDVGAQHKISFNLKPKEIFDRLSDYVVGQEDAKKALSIALYNHHKRISSSGELDIVEKSNVLMIGPSGSGKTILAENLAGVMGVPFVIADSTLLTEAGYNGADVESILSRLLDKASGDIELAEKGIVFIDEVDKIRMKSAPGTIDVGGQGVQQSLLKMIEGSIIQVKQNSKSSGEADSMVEINTKNILFVFSGAFVDMDDVCDINSKESKIGFAAKLGDSSEVNMKEVDHKKLVKYGLIQEFVSRIPIITKLNPITVDMMVDILTKPKNAIIKQYEKIFLADGHQLSFSEGAIKEIAKRSCMEETGARGARCTIEKLLEEAMFHLPSSDSCQNITVTVHDGNLSVEFI